MKMILGVWRAMSQIQGAQSQLSEETIRLSVQPADIFTLRYNGYSSCALRGCVQAERTVDIRRVPSGYERY